MKFFKETEKAVQVKMAIEFCNSERVAEYMVWIPKSQIRDSKLTKWIANAKVEEKTNRSDVLVDFIDANGERIETESTAAERKAAAEFGNMIARRFGRLHFN